MDDLARLRLLEDLLCDVQLTTAASLGELANAIESILLSVETISDDLRCAYSSLWEALEVLGVRHQEAETEPTEGELADLLEMVTQLKKEIQAEIIARGAYDAAR